MSLLSPWKEIFESEWIRINGRLRQSLRIHKIDVSLQWKNEGFVSQAASIFNSTKGDCLAAVAESISKIRNNNFYENLSYVFSSFTRIFSVGSRWRCSISTIEMRRKYNFSSRGIQNDRNQTGRIGIKNPFYTPLHPNSVKDQHDVEFDFKRGRGVSFYDRGVIHVLGFNKVTYKNKPCALVGGEEQLEKRKQPVTTKYLPDP